MLKPSIPQHFGMIHDPLYNPCNMVSIINKKRKVLKPSFVHPQGLEPWTH